MAVLVLGVLLVPWVVVRLPADYFAREPEAMRTQEKGSPLWMIARLLRNALGVVLLLAGIAMLVLPGQGILTMLAALSLLDLPGKRKLEHRLLGLPAVHAVVATIRRRAGRPPLIL
ncbi:MAG: PGPGW domain-containing protein [Polyangiales bacterium]